MSGKRNLSIMRFPYFRLWPVVAVCMFSPLFCYAQEAAASGEVSYLSFQVPGALGTYPKGINNSMTVTGYYYVSPTATFGFMREAAGRITTFSIRDGLWTEPESITNEFQQRMGTPVMGR
jgi:hypothetical protein